MKKLKLLITMLVITVIMTGCGETVTGVGKDINRMGRGVNTFFFRQ
ncbi:MAG: hypothetical protein WCY36_02270 [Candidatus Omnitrophota bacterium]